MTDKKLTLISETGESFTVNRHVFLQKSSYYKGMVSSGMKDSCSKALKLNALSKASLEEVYNFCLEHSEGSCDTSHDIDAGLEAAFYLQIDDMINKYSMLLTDCLHISTWFHALDLSQKYGLSQTVKIVLNFVCDNFSQCHLKDLLYLSGDEMLFLLRSDRTYAENEASLFEATIKWLSHEVSRLSFVPTLLNEIRYELMNEVEVQLCKSLLTSLIADTTLIDSAIKLNSTIQPRLRCTSEVLVALGGFTSKEFSTNRFQILPTSKLKQALYPEKDKVPNAVTRRSGSLSTISFQSNNKQKLSETLCEHGVCVVNGSLYVAGGQVHYCADGRYTTNKVYVFNPVHRIWSTCSKMHVPRSLFYFGELDGFIYAVSGYTAPNTDTSSVERYLPSKDAWEMVAPVQVRVHELAGCSHNGYLYISGGFRGPDRGHVDLVWRYNVAANQWTRRASLLRARSYHAMTAVNGKIFVVGGVRYLGNDTFEDILDGEMYDPLLDHWSQVIHIFHPASCMSSAVLDGCLFLFGGHSFVHDTDHNFIQVITLIDSEEASEEHVTEGSSRTPCRPKRSCFGILKMRTFDCRTLRFKAQRISYFGLCVMKLPRRLIDQFR